MTRTGKIARLPRPIREELNRCLDNGVPGTEIMAWANELPEVRDVLTKYFDGQPINSDNLSAWKTGGFEDWLARDAMNTEMRMAGETADDLMEMGPIAEKMSKLLTTRYVRLHYAWDTLSDEDKERRLQLLAPYCRQVTTLHRRELESARLALDRDKYELNQGWSKQQLVNFFFNWVQDIDVRGAVLYLQELSQEELMDKIKQVFGLAADWKPPGDWTDEDRARAKAKGDELRKMAAQVKAEQAEKAARQARAQAEEDRQQAEWQAQGLPPDVQETLDDIEREEAGLPPSPAAADSGAAGGGASPGYTSEQVAKDLAWAERERARREARAVSSGHPACGPGLLQGGAAEGGLSQPEGADKGNSGGQGGKQTQTGVENSPGVAIAQPAQPVHPPAPATTPTVPPAPPVPPAQPVPPRPLSKREIQGKAGFYQFKLKKKNKGIFS